MTLNYPRSRSQDFSIKYLEYDERHKVGHNGGQIENHIWACVTLNRPGSRLQDHENNPQRRQMVSDTGL